MIEKLILAGALFAFLYYASKRTQAPPMMAPRPPATPPGVRQVQQRGLTVITPDVLATANYQITALGAPSLAAYMQTRGVTSQLAGVLALDVEFRSRYGLG